MDDMLGYVKERLTLAKGKRKEISRRSGVPYDTLMNIVAGDVDNPGIKTVQTLYNFLRKQEEAA